MKTRYIDPEVVRELLHYDPNSGVFTWKFRSSKWIEKDCSRASWNTRFAGKRAGQVFCNGLPGYVLRSIRLLGVAHYEHRLAWVYMTGEQPPERLDHKNRDATDNRWCNLRDGTHINSRNLSMRRTNKSGVTGVFWSPSKKRWRAAVNLKGRSCHLGYFDEIDEAAMEVMEFRAEHGFDPQHGLAPAHYAQSEARYV